MSARLRTRHIEAARGYLMLEMPEHSLNELRTLRPEDGDAFDLHTLRAEAFRQQENYADSLAAFEAAEAVSPDHAAVLMGIAWCLKRLDRLNEAITITERLYANDPEEPVTLYNLACYYALAGDKETALSWLGRALRMDHSLAKLIPEEPDFDALRNDDHFRFIVEAVNAESQL